MNDFESWLADELKARASGVEGSASMAGAARKQARTIRTRRIVTGGAIAAVIAAVAIPTAMSLTGNPLSGPEPATTTTPVTDSPSPALTETPSEEPTTPPSDPATEPETPPTETDEPERGGTTELVLDGLPAGDSPAIGWTDGLTFHRPDGGEATLSDGFNNVLAFGDGVVGTTSRDDNPIDEVVFADSSGTEMEFYNGYGPIATSDGSLVAWFEVDAGQLSFAQADGNGTAPAALPIENGDMLSPVGFGGPELVVSNVTDADSQSLGWRADHIRGESVDWNTVGIEFQTVTAVSQAANLIAGFTEITDEGGCSAVYDGPTGEQLWDTCDYSVLGFSPDGRYALGSHAYLDGAGIAFSMIFDARTGESVHTFDTAEDGVIFDSAFEDDSHVLIIYNAGYDSATSRTAILRCELDGACETATDVRELADDEFPFGFGVQP